MSRIKEEKKRKREEEAVAEIVPKKTKKSKKTEDVQDAPAPEPAVVKTKKEKKDKKDKKSKKSKDTAESISEEAPVKEKKEKKSKKSKDTDSTPAGEAELIHDMKASENFISVDDDEPMPDSDSKKDKKKSKKDKESKKSKKNKEASEDIAPDAEVQNGDAEEPLAEKKERKDKKEKKEKKEKEKKEKKDKKAKKAALSETNGDVAEADSTTEANGETTSEEQNGEVVDGAEEGKKGRFIVFVGNLPYTATKEQIEEHFAKIKPTDIRLRTYKGNNKFMGTCFVEFDRFDRMETCLKKYHHSLFPDGKKGSEGRKINVELSAGGGGNSEERKSKIAAKNEKLHDERAKDREKRAEIEMKQGERKDKKDARAKKGGKEGETTPAEDAQPNNGYINPARLAMMSRPEPTAFKRRF